MAEIRITGRRACLEPLLYELHQLASMQLERAPADPDLGLDPVEPGREHEQRRDELRLLLARIDGLLALLAAGHEDRTLRTERVDAEALRAELDAVAPEVEDAASRLEGLEDEAANLPRYVKPLRRLAPLAPDLARLDDDDLRALGLQTVALVLDAPGAGVVDALRVELQEELGWRFDLVAGAVEDGSIGCVLVYPRDEGERVHALLAGEHIRDVPLPEAYESLSLRGAIEAMERRLAELPEAIDDARAQLSERWAARTGHWADARAAIAAELEQLDALRLAVASARVFVVVGWVPRPWLDRLRTVLAETIGEELLIEELRARRGDDEPPVLMRNAAPVRPFGTLVRFLDLPRAGTFDPSGLMAVFMPLMFGAMVGDVVYGALLLLLGLALIRRFDRGSTVRDLGAVLTIGSAWAIVFGFLYGEALGNLARREFGMEALWFYRGSPDALEPLLLFAVSLGAAHVVLGVVLGAWRAWQAKRPGKLVAQAGTLVMLSGVFAAAGVAAGQVPAATITPALAAVLVGMVVLGATHGRLGFLIGPIEVIGTLGNILSYLRLAAVGLASVYLAIVANEFATLGPLWLGLAVATLLHALNLVLAGFSPTIQSLRLHYVEFFTKFYEGGGKQFSPFGRAVAEPAGARAGT